MRQLGSQSEHWKLVALLLSYWPSGQVQFPLRALRLCIQVKQLLELDPLQVSQVWWQGKHWKLVTVLLSY